jgi:hypothetical protein
MSDKCDWRFSISLITNRPIAQSLYLSFALSLFRSISLSLYLSFALSLFRSISLSLNLSFAQSLFRSVVGSLDRRIPGTSTIRTPFSGGDSTAATIAATI